MNEPTDPDLRNSEHVDEPAEPSGLVRLPNGDIVITRVFCPNGHDLVIPGISVRFDGFWGIVLSVRGQQASGQVILSPIHGDYAKDGEAGFEPGEVLQISCPTCDTSFPTIQACGCTQGSSLIGLFLDKELKEGNQVVVCNAWGCLRSRIIDRFQVISKFG